ncbi:MAG: cell envelope integrity protein CreD [Gammaproteobacteria bacterium]|nr:cell envelope integrity protein CreD [Gammaproteobacteria bacterium]
MFEIIGLLILVLMAAGFAFLLYVGWRWLRQQTSTRLGDDKGARLTLQAGFVGLLTVLMLMPLDAVDGLISERSQRYDEVVRDVGRSWGQSQILAAPVVVIPFSVTKNTVQTVVDADGKRQEQSRSEVFHDQLLLLPQRLTIDSQLRHEVRERGIYAATVYTATVDGRARFDATALQLPPAAVVDWADVRVVVGLTDTRGITAIERLEWNGTALAAAPGTGMNTPSLLERGFHAPLALTGPQVAELQLSLTLRGSGALSLVPLGETSELEISADWPHPGFTDLLPSRHDIRSDGFDAHWQVSHLIRNYPQQMLASDRTEMSEVLAVANLFTPVTHYSAATRAVKYGVLFIGLTYLTLLGFQLGSGLRLHGVQYLLVGGALALFYLLLVALVEQVSFSVAFVTAAAVIVVSISVYAGVAYRCLWPALVLAAMLASLYALLYAMLHLEDYALLMGSGLLLAVMLVLMVLTRNLATRAEPSSVGQP